MRAQVVPATAHHAHHVAAKVEITAKIGSCPYSFSFKRCNHARSLREDHGASLHRPTISLGPEALSHRVYCSDCHGPVILSVSATSTRSGTEVEYRPST